MMSLHGDQMRVAIKDEDDVVEFRLINQVWVSESCEPVTFEFPTAVFEAVGMVPDAHSLNPQTDFFWHQQADPASIDDLPIPIPIGDLPN